MLSSKLCVIAKWIAITLSSIIFATCTTLTSNPPNIKQETPISKSQSPPESQSGSLKVSMNPVELYEMMENKKQARIKLKVEGEDAKHIEGFRFTDASVSINGKELETKNNGVFMLRPHYESPIRHEEHKKWRRPVKRELRSNGYLKKLVKNDFSVPEITSEIDMEAQTVDLKGNLALIVASEENKCLCRVKDFLAEGKLTEKSFEFGGERISFMEEPSSKVEDYNNNALVYEFLLKDSKNLLFEIYFEDGTGKEVERSSRGYDSQDDIYKIRAGFNNMKPDKDWEMVIIYSHENCRRNVPFHFENVDVSFSE